MTPPAGISSRSFEKQWLPFIGDDDLVVDTSRTLHAYDRCFWRHDGLLRAAWAALPEHIAPGATRASAIFRLSRMIQRHPASGWALILRAELRRGEGDLPEALTDVDAAASRGASAVVAAALRARILRSLGRYEEAYAAATDAIRLDPDLAWPHLLRGILGRDALRFQTMLPDLTRAARRAPKCGVVWAIRAQIRLNAGDPQGLEDIDRAVAVEPTGRVYAWRGESLRRAGRFADALADLDRALAIQPDYHLARAWRGAALSGLGRHQEALADLNAAVRTDPRRAWAWKERSLVRRRLGKISAAIDDMNKAVSLDSHYGWCRPTPDALQESMASLGRLLQKNPRHAWAWAWRGEVRLRAKDFIGAESDLSAALALAPRLSWPWCWRAEAREALGRTRGAAADLKRGLALDPDYLRGLACRARLREKLGMPRQALQDWDVVIGAYPRHLEYRLARGLLHARAGRISEGLKDLQAAATLDPSSLLVRELKERLRRFAEAAGQTST